MLPQKFPAFCRRLGPVVVIVDICHGIPRRHEVGSAIDATQPNPPTASPSTPTSAARPRHRGGHALRRRHGPEVGHNATGAGQVCAEGRGTGRQPAIAEGAIWQGEAWQQIVAGAKTGTSGKGRVLHFIGLFSGSSGTTTSTI